MRRVLDKFSELPDNVIDLILIRVSLRDAVRTGILSTKWRLHWTRTQSLLLDYRFFNEALRPAREDSMSDTAAFISIVGNILSSHNGPIHEFCLHVSTIGFIPPSDPNTMNNWIHIVSQSGVQDLTLACMFHAHPLPSSLFQCVELKHLCLRSVDLELPPHNFRKFASLVRLDLTCAKLSGDMLTNIMLNCPLLEDFLLKYFFIKAEDGSFILNAPQLRHLSIRYYNYIYFILKNIPNTTTLSIQPMKVHLRYQIGGQNIIDFFRAIPDIENIKVGSDILLDWGMQDVPEKLSCCFESHTSLVISNLVIYLLEQLRSMFCIIRSSPKLKSLDISMYSSRVRIDPQKK